MSPGSKPASPSRSAVSGSSSQSWPSRIAQANGAAEVPAVRETLGRLAALAQVQHLLARAGLGDHVVFRHDEAVAFGRGQ